MKVFRLLMPMLLLGLTVMLLSRPAHGAGCVSVEPGFDEPCTGQNCSDSHPTGYCIFGCISGSCESRGGSGLCCGHIYYTPVIYPDGGRCSPGGGCGNRDHASQSPAAKLHNPHAEQLLQGRSPGVIKLTDTVSYREPTFAYVIDRCKHEYGVLIEEEGTFVKGGI